MKSYDSGYAYWIVTSVVGFFVGLFIRWISGKLRKIDETQAIKADLDNHKQDYAEFKSETKSRLEKLDDRTYNQKK